MGGARIRAGGVAALAAAALAPGAAAAPPKVAQLIVYRNGEADQMRTAAAKSGITAGGRSCVVGAGTPLAALLRSGVTGIKVKDYGSCSRHPADAAGLYVSQIGTDRARGANGWVYKVGQRVAPAGAADYSGPFGNGRLKQGARVTWFYCRMKAKGCQRTLVATPKALGGGQVRVTVRAYDDRGKARRAAGVTVFVGGVTARTDSKGVAVATVDSASVDVYAEAKRMVRSFTEQIDVP